MEPCDEGRMTSSAKRIVSYATFSVPEQQRAAAAASRKWGPVVPGLLVVFLFAGAAVGWAPLQLMLEQDGVYLSECPVSAPRCSRRMDRLVAVFFLGNAAAGIGSLPAGWLVDQLGPLWGTALSGSAMAAGLVLIGSAQPTHINSLQIDELAVGTVLLAFGGVYALVNAMKMSFVVSRPMVNPVVTAVNCLYDSSTVVFLLLYELYAHSKLSRRTIFTGYAVLCVLVHVALFIGWWGEPVERLRQAEAREVEADPAGEEAATAEEAGARAVATAGEAPKRPRLHGLPLAQQLWSFEFCFACCWLCTQTLRCAGYLGVSKESLEQFGDAKTGHTFTQLLGALMPTAIFWAPTISWSLEGLGFGGSFALTCALGLVWNMTSMVPLLKLQVLTFMAFTAFRGAVYATTGAYLAHSFGSRTFGQVYGIVSMMAGALVLFFWPAVSHSKQVASGNVTFVFAVLLIIGVPSLIMTLELRRFLRLAPEADCCRK